MKELYILIVLIVTSCGVNSGQTIYLKEIDSNSNRIIVISNTDNSITNCDIESKIWYKIKNGFVYNTLKSILIVDEECTVQERIDFQDNVLDFSVGENFLIVSLTKDEVEIYESRLILVDLFTLERRPLEITSLGAKFSLSISESGKLFSFVHQDSRMTKQELKLYDLKSNQIRVVDQIDLTNSFYSNIQTPPNSDWSDNYLYYTRLTSDSNEISLYRFDHLSNENKLIMNYSNDKSQYFQVGINGNLIFYKRVNSRFRKLISYDIITNKESIIYETNNFLSDQNTFTIVRD